MQRAASAASEEASAKRYFCWCHEQLRNAKKNLGINHRQSFAMMWMRAIFAIRFSLLNFFSINCLLLINCEYRCIRCHDTIAHSFYCFAFPFVRKNRRHETGSLERCNIIFSSSLAIDGQRYTIPREIAVFAVVAVRFLRLRFRFFVSQISISFRCLVRPMLCWAGECIEKNWF